MEENKKEWLEKAKELLEPEAVLWDVEAKPLLKEQVVATMMLLAYDQACADAEAGHITDEGPMAESLFMESLTKDEAAMPFTRMLMVFGPVLHWNDVADICFWTLGLPLDEKGNGWNSWLKYRDSSPSIPPIVDVIKKRKEAGLI